MTYDPIDRLRVLATEAINAAIGSTVKRTISSARALEALGEFQTACDPVLILDLIDGKRLARLGDLELRVGEIERSDLDRLAAIEERVAECERLIKVIGVP